MAVSVKKKKKKKGFLVAAGEIAEKLGDAKVYVPGEDLHRRAMRDFMRAGKDYKAEQLAKRVGDDGALEAIKKGDRRAL